MNAVKSYNFAEDSDPFVVEPASISWNNIEVFSRPGKKYFFFQDSSKQPVPIIKGGKRSGEVSMFFNLLFVFSGTVSGAVKAGKTLAIMGSSGAGKTTLLNVLTARNLSRFMVDGEVMINNQLADIAKITSMTAYVQQEDLFVANLTVRENLVFQAMMRMNSSLSVKVRAKRVFQVMQEVSTVRQWNRSWIIQTSVPCS